MSVEDLNQNYNPAGALGGMFAPAYVHGYAPSQAAVQDWTQQNQGVTADMIEQTRMPNVWQEPEDEYTTMMRSRGKGNVYGEGRVPDNLNFDPRGPVDPNALLSASQGGPYDMGARRDAIAARVMANDAAKTAFYAPKEDPYGMYRQFGGGYQAPEYTGGG